MILAIAGKRYELEFVPRLRCYGICSPPHDIGKKIQIRASLKGLPLLDTLIHEMLHGSDWSKDESWVEQTATDIARSLWRLGYRREADEPER